MSDFPESETFTDDHDVEKVRLPGRGLPSLYRNPAFHKLPLWRQLELEGRGDLAALVREDFEERAAIMEYHGGMGRQDAERAAHALVLEKSRGGRFGR